MADSRMAWADRFGDDADRYDRARPSYPQPLIDRIATGDDIRRVLDVGCGTGILSRQLAAAGLDILGVDVDPRMAETARESGIEAEVAKFEDWDPAGRRFDGVVSGMTWHWLDPAAAASKAADALAPGGRLAVFWNAGHASPALSEAFAAAYREMPGPLAMMWSVPAIEGYAGVFDRAREGMRAAGRLSEPEEWRDDWEWRYTRDAWLDQLPTFGGHNRLPPDKLDELLEATGAAIDAVGGEFTMHYTTVTITAARNTGD